MDEFLIRALLGGIGVALLAGPLGAFVIWRKMAFFGDTLSHASLLGIALGMILGVNLTIGVGVVGVSLAVALVFLQRQRNLTNDTLLGIISHTALSLGLIAVTFLETVRVDLMSYLFGDILSVSWSDIAILYGAAALILGTLALLWRQLLVVTLDPDLARVEGVPVTTVQFIFVILLALAVAVAMKLVGALLMTALLMAGLIRIVLEVPRSIERMPWIT